MGHTSKSLLVFVAGILWGTLMGLVLLFSIELHAHPRRIGRHAEAADRMARTPFPWLGTRRRSPGPSPADYRHGIVTTCEALARENTTMPEAANIDFKATGMHPFKLQVHRDTGYFYFYGTDARDRQVQVRGSALHDPHIEMQFSLETYPGRGQQPSLMVRAHHQKGESFFFTDNFYPDITPLSPMPLSGRFDASRDDFIGIAQSATPWAPYSRHPLTRGLLTLTETTPLELRVPLLNGTVYVLTNGEIYP